MTSAADEVVMKFAPDNSKTYMMGMHASRNLQRVNLQTNRLPQGSPHFSTRTAAVGTTIASARTTFPLGWLRFWT